MMRRSIALPFAACAIVALPAVSGAQSWNDSRSRTLVEQATERRARQIADTALASYQAAAHGYLTFLAQLGEGFTEPPRIVKADELALEVYWQAPNLSKQRIAARRDTLLLPTDINYHRDHLGIVQNNFPSIIRLGDGDEVRDVPHPLSAEGLELYDFAVRDSLEIRLGPRRLQVYEVRVRPRNDRQPRAVGAVYIDRESGEVVRMAFSFTRAALKDKELEDVSVVLENGLIDGRFWLPRRQEIEVRRTGSWLDYPARGIIRGRWEICCYQVNKPLPPGIFAGPEIGLAPRGTRPPFPFTGQVLDSLPPDVRAVTDADVARVQEEARALVRAQALARSRSFSLSARSFSDFIRVNRVEGFAFGGGLTQRLGDGFAVSARARYGSADHDLKGRVAVSFRRANGLGLTLAAYRDFMDAGDVMETSLARNSIAAQEFGSDYTDPFGVRGGAFTVRGPALSGWVPSLEAAAEEQRRLVVRATPSFGRYEPTIPAWFGTERRMTLALDRPAKLGPLGFETRIHVEGSFLNFHRSEGPTRRFDMLRLSARAEFEKPLGQYRIMAQTLVAGVIGDSLVTPQRQVFLGGPVTAPGYEYHEFHSNGGLSQRVELRIPAPGPSIRLGRYGKTPRRITLAPYANVIWSNNGRYFPRTSGLSAATYASRHGWFPSVGLGALSIFDLLRVDVARGLRGGRWTFSVDVGRGFWGIL